MLSKDFLMLMLAIILELVATTSLKLAEGGSRPWWYLTVVGGYAGALYLFSLALRTLPLGVAYAIWAGVGIIGTAVIGRLLFKQSLTLPVGVGMLLILLGAILVNAGTRSAG